jgi:hypothetical protein
MKKRRTIPLSVDRRGEIEAEIKQLKQKKQAAQNPQEVSRIRAQIRALKVLLDS